MRELSIEFLSVCGLPPGNFVTLAAAARSLLAQVG